MDLVYTPLPHENCIRILEGHLIPQTGKLICNFKVVSLDDGKDEYAAVSYAWEGTNPVTRLEFIGGQSVPLTDTLRGLFSSLRHHEEAIPIWVDSICINQQDPKEKASQVLQMGKVFSSAKRVLVWLGPSNSKARDAFRFMETKQSLSWPEDWEWENEVENDSPKLELVFSLLGRPWFRRVWVIQEVTLNDNVVVACGDDRIDFTTFELSVTALWKFWDGLNDYENEHPAVLGLWSVSRLFFIRRKFLEDGSVRYETLLQAALKCLATDKRDMVFAFRGIADKDRPVPEPDYTESATVDRIYRQTAEALLCHGSSLDLLALGGVSMKRSDDLPTWVPDFRHHAFIEPFEVCDSGCWDAGGPLLEAPRVVAPNELQLQLKVFDIVQTTCPIFDSDSVADQKAALEAILALKKRDLDSESEESWMQNLAIALIMGLNVDEDPPGPEDHGLFREWLQWLQQSSCQEDLEAIRKNTYHKTIGPRVDGWRAFMTKGSSLCIGPPEVEVGDIVCAVPGCRLPIVLREVFKTTDTAGHQETALVGWCYARDMMQGEVMASSRPLISVMLS